MIDLNDAGRRLAATRVAPTPPIATLHARRARRTRHRRLAATGIITTMLALIALGAVLPTTGNRPAQRVSAEPPPTPGTTTVTLPADPGPAGSTPYDFGRLRLWLPKGWTTSYASNCQAANQVLYVPSNDSLATPCATTATDRLVVQPLTAVPHATDKTVINGITVFVLGTAVSGASGQSLPFAWFIPSLDAQITIAGAPAEEVAATLEPSPLKPRP